MIQLRPYQTEAIEGLRNCVRRGVKSMVLVLPTGGGKTLCASAVMQGALERGSRLLFIAHRRELITQCYEKMIDMGVDPRSMGIIMGNGSYRRRDGVLVKALRPNAPVQIGSVDTIRHRDRRSWPKADIVFVDEAHRCLANSYVKIKEHYSEAIHIGLTATPYRNGGKGLGGYYDELVVGATPSFLIREGFICAPRVWTVPSSELPDLSGIKMKRGDYDERALAEQCNTRKLVGSLVEHWKRHGGNHRTVAFAVSVEHSKRICQEFKDAGVAAEHLDGETPTGERDAIIARLASGETRIVTNVMCLAEGFDLPSVKCGILARPTRSTGLYLQQAGRFLRPWEGVTPVLLDHAGVALQHGLPSEDREFSLLGKTKEKGATTKTCTSCFAIAPSFASECPACGESFVVASDGGGPDDPLAFEYVDGTLVELTPDTVDQQRAYWDELCEIVQERNYSPHWASHKFKDKYNVWPPRSFPKPDGRAMTEPEIVAMEARLTRVAQSRGIPMTWVTKKVAEARRQLKLHFETEQQDDTDDFPFGENVRAS